MHLARDAIVVASFLSLLAAALVPVTPAASVTAASSSQDQTWTVMVYMAADALPELPWQDDINEMESVDQPDGMNVVALVDPLGPDNTMLLHVTHDPNHLDPTIVSEVLPYDAEVDMASPTTLSQFIGTATSMFPADRYVLDLWGHGDGWRGVCLDGYDLLTIPETGTALSDATDALGRRIDVVVMDSCAEGTLECAYEIRGCADYLAASEKDVQAAGLPYGDVLGTLAADLAQTPKEFGVSTVDAYIAWAHYGSYYSATMAVYDLTLADALVERLGVLSEQGTRYDRLFGDLMYAAAVDSESYDDEWAFDLGDFVGRLRRADLPLEMKDSALRFVSSYEEFVAYFGKYEHPSPLDGQTVVDASGITAYAPSADLADAAYGDLQISLTPWYVFGLAVRDSTEVWPNEQLVDVTLADSPDDGDADPDSAELTWHDVSGSDASFQAWVFGSYGLGVSLLQTEVSSSPDITVDDVFGTLVIAASASVGGSAVSYQELTVQLVGTVRLEVEVDRLGEPQVGGYEVYLLRPGAEPLRLDAAEGSFVRELRAPSEIDLGTMYSVQVVDGGTGLVVGETRVVLWGTNASLSIEALPPGEEGGHEFNFAVAAIAVAASAALIAYAVFVRSTRRP